MDVPLDTEFQQGLSQLIIPDDRLKNPPMQELTIKKVHSLGERSASEILSERAADDQSWINAPILIP